jgi:PrgI family protein
VNVIDTGPQTARIPADIDREDRVLAGLTAHQVAILAAAGVLLWGLYWATNRLVPLPVYGAVAAPLGAAVAALALGRRDGLSLDRLALVAFRQARSPRRMVTAPSGVAPPPAWVAARAAGAGPLPAPLRLPARRVRADGVIDLEPDRSVVLAACSTVNFALKTGMEQEALVAVFARYLNSLSGPLQVLIRAERVDLAPSIAALEEAAPGLPHPALEDAAREHAAFLADLATRRDLLRRQVLLAFPDTSSAGLSTVPAGTVGASGEWARRYAEDAVRALAPAGVAVAVLDGAQALAVLAAAFDPDTATPLAGLSAPDEVITCSTGGTRGAVP